MSTGDENDAPFRWHRVLALAAQSSRTAAASEGGMKARQWSMVNGQRVIWVIGVMLGSVHGVDLFNGLRLRAKKERRATVAGDK